MSKFMKQEDRDQAIKELMVSIRRNSQGSNCIDNFESFLKEIPDKDYVDTVITDMTRFVSEFSRLSHDIDNLKNIDFISRIMSKEFIKPSQFFYNSHKKAQLYLSLYDILKSEYAAPIYNIEKSIVLPASNFIGDLEHYLGFSPSYIVKISQTFGKISDLSVSEVKEKLELSRRIVLLYDYIPAIVKAMIQTKRRSFNLDKNSKKFIGK